MAGFEIVKKDNQNGLDKIVQPVAVWLVLLAVFVAFDSVFKFEISNVRVAIVIALSTAASYLVKAFCTNIKRVVVTLSGLVAFVAFVVFVIKPDVQTMLLRGIQPFYNKFVIRYNWYYGTELLSINEEEGIIYPSLILFFSMFVLGVIISFIAHKKKGILVVVLIVFAPVIVDSIVGYLPSSFSSWLLLVAFVLFWQCYRNKDNTLSIKEFVPTGIGLLAVLIVGAMTLPVVNDYVKKNEKEYLEVRDKIEKLQSMEKVTLIETENRANYAEGGIGEGNLSNVSRFMPSGKKIMEVTLSEKPDEDIYIKAYVGAVYEDEKWRELYSVDYEGFFDITDGTYDEYELMQEPYNRIIYGTSGVSPVDMYIDKIENDENGYIPYYALPSNPDLVVKDLYVKSDGGKNSSCQFFFRTDAEYINEEKLYAASDNWFAYRDFVHDYYLENPTGLNQLEDICSNMYISTVQDAEDAISAYFEENLSYSVAPGKCPEGEEFVEYFLFENRRGFCVHFATAATIMYRYMGIPSRYVEGYYIPQDAFKKQSDGTYKAVVEDGMAHAWCEIYDDNLGWKVKEHTLGYDGSLTPNNANTENVTTANTNNQQETTTVNAENSTTATNEEITTVSKANEETATVVKSGNGIGKSAINLRQMLKKNLKVIIILVIVIGIELQRRVRYKLKKRKFARIKDNLGVANIYSAICDICVFQGMKMKNKSDREILQIMKFQFEQIKQEEWDWMFELAEKSAFSEKMAYSDDREKMIRLYTDFRKKILSEMIWYKKVWFLYVLAM